MNDITYKVRGAVYSVYNELGPGLIESVYEAALAIEIEQLGLRFQTQVPLNVSYRGNELGLGFRMDMVVEDMVVLELKSISEIQDIHLKQLNTYLKLSKKPLGILINFNTENLNKNIKRIVNGDIEGK